MSFLNLLNIHGNKQVIMGRRGHGLIFVEIYLHTCLNVRNGESAIIIYALPYNNAVTAPILLPHITTLYPIDCKY